jgi:adenylate cyclase
MVKGQAGRVAQILGELPRFVRDAVREQDPAAEVGVGPELDEDEEATALALVDLGVAEAEAREAVRNDRVPLVLAQQVLGDKPRYTIEDLAKHSGVPAEFLREVRLASGLPLRERYTRSDLVYARRLDKLLEILAPEAVLRAARARGTVLATAARSDLGTVRDELIVPMRRAGADDLTVAVAMAEAARELESVARDVLVYTYSQHLEAAVGSELSAVMARSGDPELQLAVGFVDVVGWTRLSSRVDPEGLDAVLDAFEQRVVDVIRPDGDVGVVKYVGDAVMLVAPDARQLAAAMIELTRFDVGLEDAPLRGGLAAGAVHLREGDYYGDPVNLAARLTDLARPWSLLADEQLEQELGAGFSTKRIRPVRIRGLGLRRPLRLKDPEESASGG